jgi:hypothetical protein
MYQMPTFEALVTAFRRGAIDRVQFAGMALMLGATFAQVHAALKA